MLRLLLTFAAICSVYCRGSGCPEFDAVTSKGEIFKELKGTMYIIFTTSKILNNCERFTFFGTGSERMSINQSDKCCRRYDKYQVTDAQVTASVTSLNKNRGCGSKIKDPISYKAYTTVGSGDDFCAIIASCRSERQGAFVLCRRPDIPDSLRKQLMALKTQVPNLKWKEVNQKNCKIPDNVCSG